MDLSDVAKRLGLSESKHVIRKAAELRRLCDIQFDCSVIGVVSVSNLIVHFDSSMFLTLCADFNFIFMCVSAG